MSELSEEEIIKDLKKIIDTDNCWLEDEESADEDMIEWAKLEKSAIQGLLDLYQKEKQKNKELEDKIKGKIKQLQTMYNKLPKNPKEHLHSKTEYKIVIGELQELLEERN